MERNTYISTKPANKKPPISEVQQLVSNQLKTRKTTKLKNKALLIITIIFFLTINTTYYWEGKLGFLAFPAFIFLVIIYFGLVIALIWQTNLAVKEKLSNKYRLITIGLLTLVLTITFYKPIGIIDLDKLEGKNLLIAQREGVANCTTTFKLKDNFTFKERNVCFGISEVKGIYKISNDTIYFAPVKQGNQEDIKYEFGVIEELEHYTENKYALKLFVNKSDTTGFKYFIGRNDLDIEPIITPNL
ncbi:hypothetical protein OO013_07720 [Mangrovivirga sp. M17]|uniref:DUF4352 domain-containing protein n=1 Tax=Mangrovivirga halotolerans TaxID=2993936 RepID=A0ABT3RPN2_9BACT|nr:hypothetical protein [Mangrovivirga halotolerans]MCX2743747.1 hypothetical protein [Mangrovivirga halotolerans]